MKSKICRYCGEEFSEIDFPAQFERMVTCGKVKCMKSRRIERIEEKNSIRHKTVNEPNWGMHRPMGDEI